MSDETQVAVDEAVDQAPMDVEDLAPEASGGYFSPDDELDLSGEGLAKQRVNLRCVEANYVEHAEGQKWEIFWEPVGVEVTGLANQKARDNGFTKHASRPNLVGMGKGILKRIFVAAFGKPSGKLSDLPGRIVSAELSEDDNGFTRVRGYRKAEQTASDEGEGEG